MDGEYSVGLPDEKITIAIVPKEQKEKKIMEVVL